MAGEAEWHLIDAQDRVLGRLATSAARLLLGKHRVESAPQAVAPVNVVIINTDKVAVTGRKEMTKTYRRYTGYPGGLRTRTLREQRRRDSRWLVEQAVAGMLPKNSLRPLRLRHLKLYRGSTHPHEANLR